MKIGTYLPHGEKGKRRFRGEGTFFDCMIKRGYARIRNESNKEVIWNKLIVKRLKLVHKERIIEFIKGYDLLEY